MMIGICGTSARDRSDGFQRRVARADDERVGIAAALEGVLDEAGLLIVG